MSNYYNYHPTTGKKLSSLGSNIYEDEDGNKIYENPFLTVNLLLINEAQEILLLERNEDPFKGSLDTPGGFVEPGETAEFALKREIKEELNFEVEDLKYFGTYSDIYPVIINSSTYERPTITIIYYSILKRTPKLTISSEITNPKFYKFAEISKDKIKFKSIKSAIIDFEKEFILDEDTEDLVNFHLD